MAERRARFVIELCCREPASQCYCLDIRKESQKGAAAVRREEMSYEGIDLSTVTFATWAFVTESIVALTPRHVTHSFMLGTPPPPVRENGLFFFGELGHPLACMTGVN